jgi:transcriptional regulator with GAF, ATPase, and Fis domain
MTWPNPMRHRATATPHEPNYGEPSMTSLALPSAITVVAQTAAELLDLHISEQDAVWIMTTALVVEALRRTKGNKCRAARLLGMHRNTINRHTRKRSLDSLVEDLRKFVELHQMDLFRNKSAYKVAA